MAFFFFFWSLSLGEMLSLLTFGSFVPLDLVSKRVENNLQKETAL